VIEGTEKENEKDDEEDENEEDEEEVQYMEKSKGMKSEWGRRKRKKEEEEEEGKSSEWHALIKNRRCCHLRLQQDIKEPEEVILSRSQLNTAVRMKVLK
jgi:hypothetical protein